jgi:hypothetical protein
MSETTPHLTQWTNRMSRRTFLQLSAAASAAVLLSGNKPGITHESEAPDAIPFAFPKLIDAAGIPIDIKAASIATLDQGAPIQVENGKHSYQFKLDTYAGLHNRILVTDAAAPSSQPIFVLGSEIDDAHIFQNGTWGDGTPNTTALARTTNGDLHPYGTNGSDNHTWMSYALGPSGQRGDLSEEPVLNEKMTFNELNRSELDNMAKGTTVRVMNENGEPVNFKAVLMPTADGKRNFCLFNADGTQYLDEIVQVPDCSRILVDSESGLIMFITNIPENDNEPAAVVVHKLNPNSTDNANTLISRTNYDAPIARMDNSVLNCGPYTYFLPWTEQSKPNPTSTPAPTPTPAICIAPEQSAQLIKEGNENIDSPDTSIGKRGAPFDIVVDSILNGENNAYVFQGLIGEVKGDETYLCKLDKTDMHTIEIDPKETPQDPMIKFDIGLTPAIINELQTTGGLYGLVYMEDENLGYVPVRLAMEPELDEYGNIIIQENGRIKIETLVPRFRTGRKYAFGLTISTPLARKIMANNLGPIDYNIKVYNPIKSENVDQFQEV